MEESVAAYVESVGQICAEVLDGDLRAAWMVGSLATGDFDIRRSDIDVIVVSEDGLGVGRKSALGDRLRHGSLPCPAHGLDLLVYRLSEAARLQRAPRYEFSISSGVEWDDEVGAGGPYPGGLIDLALARQCGIPILGATPQETVSDCPETWLLEELRRSVEWHESRVHDPFHDPTGANAVLNASRALYFLSHRQFASKSAGARWLLASRHEPVVARALAERKDGGPTDRLDRGDVQLFLRLAARELES